MQTFRNKNYTKRDYECTNVALCQAEERPSHYWEEANEEDILKAKCEPLFRQGGIRYFGYL